MAFSLERVHCILILVSYFIDACWVPLTHVQTCACVLVRAGFTKVQSSCPGQVDCAVGRVTVYVHELPHKKTIVMLSGHLNM